MHAARLAGIGPDPAEATAAIQGLLIHGEALQRYGLSSQQFSRETLPVETRLTEVLAADDRPLNVERKLRDRSVGTCRDYTVLLCAAMRLHECPARVRCGFASYFTPNLWQDHWICEVRPGAGWRRIDPQLDDITRDALGVRFDPSDLPSEVFLSADEAWRECRAGRIDPRGVGNDQLRGLWFVYVNLVRDRLALTDCMTSEWDGWRAAQSNPLSLNPEMLAQGDCLASGEPNGGLSITPWWL